MKLNLRLVTFHAGFLPHEEKDPSFAKLLGRIRQVADLFAVEGMSIALETGQESGADDGRVPARSSIARTSA